MKPAPFDYLRPSAVEEAVTALGETGDDARILAGGLSLVPMMNFRVVTPAVVVDIGGLEELRRITDEGSEIEVGAGVAQAGLERWPGLARRLPLLAAAFPHVGHYPTRARGTVGGSVAHADPSAELPLALAVLDGAVRLRSAGGERLVPARAFFEGPLETACGENEMVAATRWPTAAPGARHAFDEVALRHGDFAIASCAVVLHEDRMAIGFGGVADVPVVREWPQLGGSALDDALACLAEEIEIADDGDGGGAYRRGLVRTLGRRTVERAAASAPVSPMDGAGDPAMAQANLRLGTTSGGPRQAAGRLPRDRGSAENTASWEMGGLPARAGSKASQSPRGREARTPRAPASPGGRLRAGERQLVEFVLNGERCAAEAPPRLLLSDFLRQRFGRRGVHVGCEHGVCGACTVRLDGTPARACLLFAVQVDGRCVDTVEGLAGPGGAHSPLQAAFRRHHALQCGYCTPGILMTMTEWLERLAAEGRSPGEDEIRAVLSGHLCRCTGYEPIVAAVLDAATGPSRAGGSGRPMSDLGRALPAAVAGNSRSARSSAGGSWPGSTRRRTERCALRE